MVPTIKKDGREVSKRPPKKEDPQKVPEPTNGGETASSHPRNPNEDPELRFAQQEDVYFEKMDRESLQKDLRRIRAHKELSCKIQRRARAERDICARISLMSQAFEIKTDAETFIYDNIFFILGKRRIIKQEQVKPPEINKNITLQSLNSIDESLKKS